MNHLANEVRCPMTEVTAGSWKWQRWGFVLVLPVAVALLNGHVLMISGRDARSRGRSNVKVKIKSQTDILLPQRSEHHAGRLFATTRTPKCKVLLPRHFHVPFKISNLARICKTDLGTYHYCAEKERLWNNPTRCTSLFCHVVSGRVLR